MFFSVIITAYNRADKLRDSLEAIFNQSMSTKDYEVIVVDDGSTDNTREVVEAAQEKHKTLRYFYQENSGQGVGRNTGVEAAKGKIVVLIQDDIIVTHDFLYEHQKFHYLHPDDNVGVLGFTAWHPKLSVNPYMQWLTNGSSFFGRYGGHQFAYEKLRGKKLADYNFFYTSNISLKKVMLEKFPFDSVFSGYGWEDIELGYRLQQKANFKLLYNSWAIAYHDHAMALAEMPRRMEAIGASAWLIHKKYPQLKKVPGAIKWLILKLLSNPINLWLLEILHKIFRGRISSIYFYCLSKKYLLRGLKKGKSMLK